jgi:hypothetical protein
VYWPAAVQLVADEHEISARELKLEPEGLGVDWIAHVLPFQCSASVNNLRPDWLEYCPATVQLVADEHEIPARKLSDELRGLGVGWIAHVRPFQCSASVVSEPELLR